MTPTFKDKFIRSRKDPIHLVRTKDSAGRDCFYFLLARKSKLKSFKQSVQEVVNIGDYGVIIASGFGHEVPEETKQMLKNTYNFDFDSLK